MSQSAELDPTTDAALRSWIDVAAGSDFPIQNLPYGAYAADRGAHLCVAIGDRALDLFALANAGLFDDLDPRARAWFCAPHLGPLLEAGRSAWRAARARISLLVRAGDETIARAGLERALLARKALALVLPVDVPDYVDFYSSLEHATNVGKIFRPGGEPLLPNWRYVPIGYHGRTSTLALDGTPVVRPNGQRKTPDGPPTFGASRALDFELELGFVTGSGPQPPASIGAKHARDAIFGTLLLNDWSARDIQAWENQPLGPFLSKSFATSLSPWVVTLDALEPFRSAGPAQHPAPLPYLHTSENESYDIALEALITSAAMRERGLEPQRIARSNFRAMYWSMAQQLAHASSNGARVRAGDLFGSGTISGSDPGSYGSLIELTWAGTKPFSLSDGSARAYLEDGDEVTLRGWCAGDGRARIGFGEVRGRIAAATALPAEWSPDP